MHGDDKIPGGEIAVDDDVDTSRRSRFARRAGTDSIAVRFGTS
ncbi:hypothetical protein [Streptomyces aureus]|uniref:Uncharacterized protein n=1 Tax=Streptomyces aureus TaxID=193461 RepID=A0ABV4SSF4_9ACTN